MLASIMKPFIMSAARHALTSAAGFLAFKGVISGSAVTEFVASGMFMVGVLWAMAEKLGHGSMLEMLTQRHQVKIEKTADKLTPPSATVGIALFLALFMGAATLGAGEASAAQKPRSKAVVRAVYVPTQAKVKINPLLHPIKAAEQALGIDPQAYLNQISKASLEDLGYAKALADGAGTAGAKMRSACWSAWIDLIHQTSGAKAGVDGGALGPTPESAAFTRIEQLAQFADAMQPAGPFMLACSPVSATMKLQVKDMVNKVATGGLKALLSLIPGI